MMPAEEQKNSERLVNELMEELKCALCLDLFQNPRVLACQHTFCHYCLQQLCKNLGMTDHLLCPLCRHKTAIPPEGIIGLPPNNYLSNIVQHVQSCTAAQASPIARLSAPIERSPSLEWPPKGPCVDLSGIGESCEALNSRHSRPPSRANTSSDFNQEIADIVGSGSQTYATTSILNPSIVSPSPAILLHIAPVEVTMEDVRRKVLDWAKSLWFAPQQLQHIIQSMEIVMKYVPFFIFDVRTNTKYEAKIYHKCKSSTNQMVIESWTPVSGIRTGYHESLIACANNTLREAVKPMKSEWIPSKAIPTQIPIAPEIAINWEEAWVEDDIANEIEAIEAGLCTTEIELKDTDDFIAGLSLKCEFTEVLHTLVYLPVYVGEYHYNDRKFEIVVNGQTGAVHGGRPLGWGNATSIVQALAAPLRWLKG